MSMKRCTSVRNNNISQAPIHMLVCRCTYHYHYYVWTHACYIDMQIYALVYNIWVYDNVTILIEII